MLEECVVDGKAGYPSNLAWRDSMAREKRRMDSAEFAATVPLLNISEDRIAAARAVLVGGEGLQSVGTRYSWTRQAVNETVNVVLKTYEKLLESRRISAGAKVILPRGWVQVTLIAPEEMVADFKRQIEFFESGDGDGKK